MSLVLYIDKLWKASNSRVDEMYNDFNIKFDSVDTHVKELEIQNAQMLKPLNVKKYIILER